MTPGRPDDHSAAERTLPRPKRDGVLVHREGVGTFRSVRVAGDVSLGEAALAELYERHVAGAVRLATLLTGDPSTAEDLAHEGFIRCAGRFQHLRRSSSFDAYLKRTVVNLCYAGFRRRRLERETSVRDAMREPVAPAAYSPEDRDLVWSAIMALPFRQRAAVVLRYYEDLSEEDTAQVLRCSARAANALVSRAMTTLRRQLAREDA
jgi:RNA polymerase sigma factor (sigma-70 family)